MLPFGCLPQFQFQGLHAFLPSGFPFSPSVLCFKGLVALNMFSLQYFPVSCFSSIDVEYCFIDLIFLVKSFNIPSSYLLVFMLSAISLNTYFLLEGNHLHIYTIITSQSAGNKKNTCCNLSRNRLIGKYSNRRLK